jgi:4-hydroxy-tetrahydrodipicolinate reductase
MTDSVPINLIIHGHNGKFGKTILECIKDNKNINYIGNINRTTDYSSQLFQNLITNSNIVILDITSDIGCHSLLENLIKNKIYFPLIIGSTGNLPLNLINEYSKHVAVAQISNFSDGISTILKILPQINMPNMEIKIYETHHKQKKDMPSGTAKTLADEINLPHSQIFSAREDNTYGIHEIIYENDYEKITIIHETKNRNIFAIGCIKWIEKINVFENGLYKN